MIVLSRRKLILAGGGLALAEVTSRIRIAEACGPSAQAPAPRVCATTHDNIEGPYYRAGAPERSDLTTPGMKGTPLGIEGRVVDVDCKTPLRDAELDIWQANGDGHYDNDGTMKNVGMLLRGRVRTDGDGRYRVKSILPGRYLNGRQFRPAHVHVKLRAKDHQGLTTQLYFPDDPFNDVDPFIHQSLVMDVKKVGGALEARFDFVLSPAAKRSSE
jgi:protocatechuate 3,4-dioxygenase beta subunit